MQINGLFGDHQSQPSAGNFTHIRGAMEWFKKMDQVSFWDTYAPIANLEDKGFACVVERDRNGLVFGRVFDGI